MPGGCCIRRYYSYKHQWKQNW